MKNKKKSLGQILLNVFVYLLVFLAFLCVVFAGISKKKSDGAVEIFGYKSMIVVSESMAKCDATYKSIEEYKIKDIPLKSLIFVETVPDNDEEAEKWFSELKVGDVLTFRYVYTSQVTITHRITEIEEKETGGYLIHLKGDNRSDEKWGALEQVIDTSAKDTSYNYILGKVVGQNRALGWVVYAMKQPKTIFVFVITPCVIIIIMEIIRILKLVKSDKKEKENNEKLQRENEIEELKKQLLELQASNANKNVTESETSENENN